MADLSSLKAALGPDTPLRPFVVNGNLTQASVLLVGSPPEPPMAMPFSVFYNADTGDFAYDQWWEYHKKVREKALAKGAKGAHVVDVARNRSLINQLRFDERLGGVPVIDANLMTMRAISTNNNQPATQLFKTLLEVVKPKLVILYDPETHRELGLRIEPDFSRLHEKLFMYAQVHRGYVIPNMSRRVSNATWNYFIGKVAEAIQ